MDAKSADTRPRLSHRVGALVDSFETVIYAIAFLLLVLLMLFRPNGVFVRQSSVTVRA